MERCPFHATIQTALSYKIYRRKIIQHIKLLSAEKASLSTQYWMWSWNGHEMSGGDDGDIVKDRFLPDKFITQHAGV